METKDYSLAKTAVIYVSVAIGFLSIITLPEWFKSEPKYEIEYKIVRDKREKVETEYGYTYSLWAGDFVLQPDVQTKYYIIYQDGSSEKVDMEEYLSIKVGDTRTKRVKVE